MADRALLHRSKIEEFKTWLQAGGWTLEDPKGYFEIIRARKPGRSKPLIIFTTDNKGSDHITVPNNDIAVVRAFIKEGRNRQ